MKLRFGIVVILFSLLAQNVAWAGMVPSHAAADGAPATAPPCHDAPAQLPAGAAETAEADVQAHDADCCSASCACPAFCAGAALGAPAGALYAASPGVQSRALNSARISATSPPFRPPIAGLR